MSNWKLGQDSYHKLVVWFTDGNTRTIYSIDWRSSYSPQRDRQLGLDRLRRCVARWGARARVVEIYENHYGATSGRPIERYEAGVKTELFRNKP